jgi:hypothetical protein
VSDTVDGDNTPKPKAHAYSVTRHVPNGQDEEQVGLGIIDNVQLIHRGMDDSFICFTKRDGVDADGKPLMKHMFSVRASELSEWIPQIVAHLCRDSFFTVNGMYRPGRGPSKFVPGLQYGQRGTSMIRYLTCNWVDCDMPGTPEDQLMAALKASAEAKANGIQVPEWSMIAHSGRGFWLFWLLRDDKSEPDAYFNAAQSKKDRFRGIRRGIGTPVRTFIEGREIAAWNRCQDQLLRAFRSVKSDAGAKDAARVTRVPGSLNTKYGDERRVAYRVNYDEESRVLCYTLAEMCALLNVQPIMRREKKADKPVDPKLSEAGRKARNALHQGRIDRMRQLAMIRGGIREGCRNYALLIVAASMRGLGIHNAAALGDELASFNAACMNPPLKHGDIRNAIAGSVSMRKIRNATIADWLSITPEESTATGWPCEGFTPDPSLKGNRAAVKQNRQTHIRMIIQKRGGELLPAADLVAALAKVGMDATTRTVQRDLKEMGWAE